MIQYILLKTLEVTGKSVEGLYFHLLLSMDLELLLICNLAKYFGRYSVFRNTFLFHTVFQKDQTLDVILEKGIKSDYEGKFC